jgi:hypothetical protein
VRVSRVRLSPESPLNLAVLRMVVPAIMLVSPESRQALAWSRIPAALRAPPEGLAWASAHLPIDPSVVRVVQVVFVVAAAASIAGIASRAALALLTLSALYLFGIVQLSGSVTHDMHLLWLAALLAASPCGDALSIDALLARRLSPRAAPLGPSLAYAWPLTCARVLLGLVYLFPGLWKLRASGLAWAFSDNLRNQMYWKWYEIGGWVPALRIDHAPNLCRAAALAVIVFELTFLPLVLIRRTRMVACAAGLLFHLLSELILKIPFFSLWGCYVVLFDWSSLRDDARALAPSSRVLGASRLVGAALVAIVFVQGARGAAQAWPFGCYPTFQWIAGDAIPDLVVTAITSDGRAVVVSDGAKSQRAWGMAWSLAGAYGAAPSESRLRAYWESIAREPRVQRAAGDDVREVRFARAWFSVIPEDRGKPALREEAIGLLTLPASIKLTEEAPTEVRRAP